MLTAVFEVNIKLVIIITYSVRKINEMKKGVEIMLIYFLTVRIFLFVELIIPQYYVNFYSIEKDAAEATPFP